MSDEKVLSNQNKKSSPSDKVEIITGAEKEVAEKFAQGANDKYGRFFLAALSSNPWFVPFSLIASLKGEIDQDNMNAALRLWLQEHKEKINELTSTTNEILTRLDGFGEDVQKRIESPEYLILVRRTFKTWDEAETIEKRQMLKLLITNAGAITLCSDDQVRLFIDWIDRYHEAHFAVIKQIYDNKQGITKGTIWDNLHPGGRPQDNSAEAGLFGYLMRELNMGGIIYLRRVTNIYGQTVKTPKSTSSSSSSNTLESPFEDTKPWELSELGKEFVRYVMEDVDLHLSSGSK